MRRILASALLAALALAATVPVSLATAGKAAAIGDAQQGKGSTARTQPAAAHATRRGR